MRNIESLIGKKEDSNVCPTSAKCLPNFCPMSPIVTQFAGVLKIFAKCPQFLPNYVRGQISDFFRYVSDQNDLE